MKTLAVVCTWVMLSCPCIARTITVDDDGPADFNNIFEAIYDACDGDTVIVAAGTYTGPYNNDLDFRGKAITLRSESGPENCIIDCNGSGRAFRFHSGEDVNSVLDGFTIRNCRIGAAGGILCQSSGPTISNCIITGNHAGAMSGTGGGIGCVMSSPIITNCTIVGNSANSGGGGIYGYKSDLVINNSTISENSGSFAAGILCDEDCNLAISNCTITRNKDGGISCDGNLTITNSTISNHSTTGPGGGIYCSGKLTITNSTISNHSTTGPGGGIYCSGGLTITDSTISANTASLGGGIYCGGGNSTITNCDISGNSAEGEYAHGGGIICFGPWSLEITNSTITGNQAEWGGAICCRGANLVMNNSTLAGNSSPNGGALACDSYQQLHPSSVELSNCILWNNGAEIWNNDNSAITITYSDVRGSWPGEGNIDADPCFTEPGYWDAGAWVDGDYRLWDDSACIDAGDPNYIPEPNETDLDGKMRVVDGDEDGVAVVDMGAYEYQPAVEAEMKLAPQTLNLQSKGRWISCYIVLAEGYDAADIEPNSVLLEEEIPADRLVLEGEGAMVKFSRPALQEILADLDTPAEAELLVTGQLTDGTIFEGTDIIRVIDRGSGKSGR